MNPVQNMISIGHPYGTRAAAGDTFAITIESDRGGEQAIRWIINHTAQVGDTPEHTANQIAQLIAAAAPSQGGDPGDRLTAQVFMNPPTFWAVNGDDDNPATNLGASDILVTDPGGGLVRVIEVVLSDPENQAQKAVAPRAPGGPPTTVTPGRLTVRRKGDFFSASVEQRALARNYSGTQTDIIDVFVVREIFEDVGGVGKITGQATLPGVRTQGIHGLTPGVAPVANCVFVDHTGVRPINWVNPIPYYDYSLGNHYSPFVLPHEIGHVVLDATHATLAGQLMSTSAPPDQINNINSPKRVSRELVQFGIPGLTASQVVPAGALESIDQGALMRSWPNHP